MWTNDPVADYLRHEIEAEQWLERRPECSICGNHIQEEIALKLDGEWICDKCVSENRQWIDEYDD